MIILNGEEVHKCTECGDSFGQGVHLKGQTLTHSGEKEHKCTECGNLYGQPGNLKRHMFTHGGKKQYKCTQFDYVSSQADNLRYHIKTYFYKNQRNANGTTFLQSYNRNLHNICSSTLERRHINVRSADAHTAEGTSAFTLENSHTSTHNAFSQVPILVILNNT